ncbi:hypothetical protein H4R27_000712 [Coemansia aciculifera]|nr:hypothetical protein H4R27_000712 [Coemansia aciculifera]
MPKDTVPADVDGKRTVAKKSGLCGNSTQFFVASQHAKRKCCEAGTAIKRRRVCLGNDRFGAAVNVVYAPPPPRAWTPARARSWPKGQALTLAARRARRRSPHLPGSGHRPAGKLRPGYVAILRAMRFSGAQHASTYTSAIVGLYPASQRTIRGDIAHNPVLPRTRTPSVAINRAHLRQYHVSRRFRKALIAMQHASGANPLARRAIPLVARPRFKQQVRSSNASIVRLGDCLTLCDSQQRRKRRASTVIKIRACQRQRLGNRPVGNRDVVNVELSVAQNSNGANIAHAPTPLTDNNCSGVTSWLPVGWDFVGWCYAGQLPVGWSSFAQDAGSANIEYAPTQQHAGLGIVNTIFPAPFAATANGATDLEYLAGQDSSSDDDSGADSNDDSGADSNDDSETDSDDDRDADGERPDCQDVIEDAVGHADAQHEDTVDRLADMLDRLMQNEATALASDPVLNQEIEDLVSRLDCLSQQDTSPVIDPATHIACPNDVDANGSVGEQQGNPSTIQYWIQERCRRQGNAEISTRGIGIKIMFIRLVTDVMKDTIIEDGSNELKPLTDRSDEEIIWLHRQKYLPGKVGYIRLPGEQTLGDGQAPGGTCNGYDEEDVVEIVEQGRIPRRQQ